MSDANNIQALAAGVGIHAPVTTPQPFYWSVRRELWENRSIYIAPLSVAGLIMLCALYGGLYRKIRKLSEGPRRMIFVGILIFVIIRGFAEAEPFDLLLPLWAIVLITFLVTREDAVSQEIRVAAIPFDPVHHAGLTSTSMNALQGNSSPHLGS